MQIGIQAFLKKHSIMEFSVINVTIPAGDNAEIGYEILEGGNVVAVALLTDDSPSEPVNVKINNANNDVIHPSVNYKEYIPTNGNHFESRKRMNFKGGSKVKVTANSVSNLTSAFTFQMLFYIETKAD